MKPHTARHPPPRPRAPATSTWRHDKSGTTRNTGNFLGVLGSGRNCKGLPGVANYYLELVLRRITKNNLELRETTCTPQGWTRHLYGLPRADKTTRGTFTRLVLICFACKRLGFMTHAFAFSCFSNNGYYGFSDCVSIAQRCVCCFEMLWFFRAQRQPTHWKQNNLAKNPVWDTFADCFQIVIGWTEYVRHVVYFYHCNENESAWAKRYLVAYHFSCLSIASGCLPLPPSFHCLLWFFW